MPSIAARDDWWYPVRLSCEQCSSELTACYKRELLKEKGIENGELNDLTGGSGIDTLYLSNAVKTAYYIEKDAELCRLAEHNLGARIQIINSTAEERLEALTTAGTDRRILYADPARRDKNGGKVFRIEDCTPNMTRLIGTMRQKSCLRMLKLSPMTDVTAALKSMGGDWETHIVAVDNEVKEIVILEGAGTHPTVTAIDLKSGIRLEMTREEENDLPQVTAKEAGAYLYEPNAALMKAGAFRTIAHRYGVEQMDKNSHLYTSANEVNNFPGRRFKTIELNSKDLPEQANVICRNYPLSAEQLRKKLKIKDGGNLYIIGTRVNGKPTLILADRLA